MCVWHSPSIVAALSRVLRTRRVCLTISTMYGSGKRATLTTYALSIGFSFYLSLSLPHARTYSFGGWFFHFSNHQYSTFSVTTNFLHLTLYVSLAQFPICTSFIYVLHYHADLSSGLPIQRFLRLLPTLFSWDLFLFQYLYIHIYNPNTETQLRNLSIESMSLEHSSEIDPQKKKTFLSIYRCE